MHTTFSPHRCGLRAGVLLGALLALGWRASLDRRDDYRACRTIDPRQVDSHWAVVTWFAAGYRKTTDGERAMARRAAAEAERMIFARWAQPLNTAAFLRRVGDRIDLVPPRLPEATAADLQAAAAILAHPAAIRPQLAQCLAFRWCKNLKSNGFPQWLAAGSPFSLPPGYGGRDTALAGVRQELDRRATVRRACAEADRQIAAGAFSKAAAVMTGARAAFSGADLEKLFAPLMKRAAEGAVETALKELEQADVTALKANHATAAQLMRLRHGWRENPYLKAAMNSRAARLQALQTKIGLARGTAWAAEMRADAAACRYWSMFQRLRAHLAAPEAEETIRHNAHATAWKTYMELLPAACDHLLNTAEREIKRARRHGLALVLFDMLEQLTAFATDTGQALPADAVARRHQARTARAVSQRACRDWFERRLIIRPFNPGLGTSFQRRLEPRLRQALSDSEVTSGVIFDAAFPAEDAAGPEDYEVVNGNFGDLDASHTPDEREILWYVRRETLEEPNPAYAEAVRRNRRTDNIPAKLITRREHHYMVERTQLRADARGTVTFSLRHGGLGRNATDVFHAVSAAIEETYVQEIIYPHQTRTVTAFGEPTPPPDPTAVAPHVVTHLPPLRHDHVRSASELKAEVREALQQLLIARIRREAGAYPLALQQRATKAEADSQWETAADNWGLCAAYCARIHPAPERIARELEKATTPPWRRKSLEADLTLHKALATLKTTVTDAAIAAAAHVIEK